MIDRRVYARALYPGSLFPEEGASIRISDTTTTQRIIDQFSDRDDHLGQWFAIEVIEQNWQFWWTSEDDSEWRPKQDGTRKTWRIYVGELLTNVEVAALPGNHETLLSNMRSNGWDTVVRTRVGNFQPFQENDVVISPEAAGGELR